MFKNSRTIPVSLFVKDLYVAVLYLTLVTSHKNLFHIRAKIKSSLIPNNAKQLKPF